MIFFTREVHWKFAKVKTWVWNGINNGFYKQGNMKKTKIIFLGFWLEKQVTLQPQTLGNDMLQNKFWATNEVYSSFCKQESGEEEQILLMDFAFSIPKGEKKCKLEQQYWVGFIQIWTCAMNLIANKLIFSCI